MSGSLVFYSSVIFQSYVRGSNILTNQTIPLSMVRYNLITIRYLLDLFFLSLGGTLTSNNSYGVMLGSLLFVYDCPIICKTVNILTNQTTPLGILTVIMPKDLVGSSLIDRFNISTLT